MKRLIGLITIILLFVGCQQETETGYIGQQFLLKADVPNEIGTFDYIWKITDLPESSELTLSDIQFSEDESQAIFIPDVAGHYDLQVTVWKYNDKLGAIAYSYDISEPNADLTAEQASNDAWLNETVEGNMEDVVENTDNITTDKPINEDSAQLTNPVDEAVKQEKIVDDAIKTAETAIQTPSSVDANYTIQIAADSNRESAQIVVDKFNTAGFDAYIQETSAAANQVMYRIRIGKFATREDAELVANRIKNEHGLDTWITKYQK